MKNRLVWGLVISIIGVILIFIPVFIMKKTALITWTYGIPIFIIGVLILLNKKEDKIEEINYKGGNKK